MAETNLWSQILTKQGLTPSTSYDQPSTILINTCAITKKGEKESLNKVKFLSQKYPKSKIIITGCANFSKIENLKNISIYTNKEKEKLLNKLKSLYSPKIKDKYSHTKRYLLKIQSGCSQYCSYCIVPFKRNYLYSLPITEAISTVKQAIKDGYKEIIITGVNIDQYQYDLSALIKSLLDKTTIKLISFGSIPLNCLTENFVSLYQKSKYKKRLSHFLHIPIQSGSNKILKLMNRSYTKSDILKKFKTLTLEIKNLKFGTDIIVGYPTETKLDFKETLNLCKQINFSKIHVFPFSPRPGTKARILFENSPKISKEELKLRSKQIQSSQQKTKLPTD